MKKVILVMFSMLLMVVLCVCLINAWPENYCGFYKNDFTVVDELDTHGGFHGDGAHYLILDCSNNVETALKNVEKWKKLPLSEHLEVLMFGGEKNGIAYGYNLSEEAHMPKIENGYYCFMDRQSEDTSDDSGLFTRYSFNIILAVYDSDTNMLYYFKFDT